MPPRVRNPPNPFSAAHLEWEGEPPPADLQVHEELAKSAVAENDSPDVGFRFSLNPYRGCFHGCAYCYARPTHHYLGFGAGTDFERHIVVKTNIVERLRATFDAKRWRGDTIAFSGNTDCYQPLEAHYELTQGCLELCLEYRNPVAVITKGTVVRRDAALLAQLAQEAGASVAVSIPFASDADARAIEPYASPPSKRFETLRILSDAGVPTTVAVAPIIPGLNDAAIPSVLERAADAGAGAAFMVLLRLPDAVRPVFTERLRAAFPDRAEKVASALRQTRGGSLYDPRFGARMRGEGPRWAAVEQLFAIHARRCGLHTRGTAGPDGEGSPSPFRRPPGSPRQLRLF